jgi:endo-1,3-1,4-beta-glycanase ExoK
VRVVGWRSGRRTPSLFLIIVLSSACLVLVRPVSAARPDNLAPIVSVTSPLAGSTVNGIVTLTATASDNVAVTQVKWYVDGTQVAWDGAAPWQTTWNSGLVAAGAHLIFAKAADAANNWGQSVALSFTTTFSSIASASPSHTPSPTATPTPKPSPTPTPAPTATPTATPAPTPTPTATPAGWTLVQSDDFSGTAVDTTKWSIYSGAGNGGNGVRAASAITEGSGLLTITAKMVNGTLVSGGMMDKLNQTYGRFEVRVRTDPDPSLVTSGVVLTWPQSGKWPVDGENDIYETTLDADRTPFKSFVHYGSTNQQYWYIHSGIDGTQWHTMAMEWEPSAIRIYRDGLLAWTVTDVNAIPDVPHHLALQLDAFKQLMTGTVRLQVDWIKIYKRS